MSRKSGKIIKKKKKVSKGGGLGNEDFDYTLDPIRVHTRKKRSLKESARRSIRKLSRKLSRTFNNFGMLSKRKIARFMDKHARATRNWREGTLSNGYGHGPEWYVGKPLRANDTKSWQHYMPGDTYGKKRERDILEAEAVARFLREH